MKKRLYKFKILAIALALSFNAKLFAPSSGELCFSQSTFQSGPCSDQINQYNQFTCLLGALKNSLAQVSVAYARLDEYNKTIREIHVKCVKEALVSTGSNAFANCLKTELTTKYQQYCTNRWAELKEQAGKACNSQYQNCIGCTQGSNSNISDPTTCLQNQCENYYQACITAKNGCEAAYTSCTGFSLGSCQLQCQNELNSAQALTQPDDCSQTYIDCLGDQGSVCGSECSYPSAQSTCESYGLWPGTYRYQQCIKNANDNLNNQIADCNKCKENAQANFSQLETRCQAEKENCIANNKNIVQRAIGIAKNAEVNYQNCLASCSQKAKNASANKTNCSANYKNCTTNAQNNAEVMKPKCQQVKHNCLDNIPNTVSRCQSTFDNCKQNVANWYDNMPSYWDQECILEAPYLTFDLVNAATNFYLNLVQVINYINNATYIPGVQAITADTTLESTNICFCPDGSTCQNGQCPGGKRPLIITYYRPIHLLQDETAIQNAGNSIKAIQEYYSSSIHTCIQEQMEKIEHETLLGLIIGGAILFILALVGGFYLAAPISTGLAAAGVTGATTIAGVTITALGTLTFLAVAGVTTGAMIGLNVAVEKIISDVTASQQVVAQINQ